jgi:colicin import membrane protein
MESFRDKARACGLAFLVHLGVVAVLLIGLFWTQSEVKPISLPGPIIEAELVGISAAPKPRAAAKPKPAPPKPAETTPEPAKPPEPKPTPPSQPQRNDQTDREKIAEMAQQKADQAQRAEEERKRQEQVLLEQQQHEERERQKQLEDIKRQHADAEKKLKLEKEKLAQLQDLQRPKPIHPTTQAVPEAAEAKTGTNGQDDSLQAQYYAAIQNAVTNNWLRPDNTLAGVRCMLRIVQIPGGDVIGVEIGNPCNADPQTRTSIEQAVKRAAPLPFKGYEKEFRREINLNFSYDG